MTTQPQAEFRVPVQDIAPLLLAALTSPTAEFDPMRNDQLPDFADARRQLLQRGIPCPEGGMVPELSPRTAAKINTALAASQARNAQGQPFVWEDLMHATRTAQRPLV